MLRFVHISDSHIGASEDYSCFGRKPYPYFKRAIQQIADLRPAPEFVLHTGDLCGDKFQHATPESYALYFGLTKQLTVPVFPLVGNHDDASSVYEQLGAQQVEFVLLGDERRCYRFSIRGETFIGLHSSVENRRDGMLAEETFIALREWIELDKNQVSIFLHHPPVKLNSPWMDREMLLSDQQNFRFLIEEFAPKIRAVFFGHVHRSLTVTKNRILYSCAPSTFLPFHLGPEAAEFSTDETGPVGFHIVAYAESSVQIDLQAVQL